MKTITITKQQNDALAASQWIVFSGKELYAGFVTRSAARICKGEVKNGSIVKREQVKFNVLPEAPVLDLNKPLTPAQEELVKEITAPATPAPKAPKTPKIPLIRESTIERPCKRVWHIADEMKDAAGGLEKLRRKDVLARCVADGIAYYTARTQYQLWLTIQNGGSI